MKKRKRCSVCILAEARLEEQKLLSKAKPRLATYFSRRAEVFLQKITSAVSISTLHACSDEHYKQIREIRETHSAIRREQVAPKLEAFKNAQSLLSKAIHLEAEAILKDGPESESAKRLKAKVAHYRTLSSQRERRLKELLEKKLI